MASPAINIKKIHSRTPRFRPSFITNIANVICNIKCAGPWENVSYVICEQQRRRSACASAQSDQRLSFCIRNLKPLPSLCGCADRFECTLVENPEDRFSRDEAQIIGGRSYEMSSWSNTLDVNCEKMVVFSDGYPSNLQGLEMITFMRPSQGVGGTGEQGHFFRGTGEQRLKNKGNMGTQVIVLEQGT